MEFDEPEEKSRVVRIKSLLAVGILELCSLLLELKNRITGEMLSHGMQGPHMSGLKCVLHILKVKKRISDNPKNLQELNVEDFAQEERYLWSTKEPLCSKRRKRCQ